MSMSLPSSGAILPARRPSRRLSGWLARLFDLHAAQRSRRALRDLDPAILRDIGLTREEALREATRGFWDWDPVRRG